MDNLEAILLAGCVVVFILLCKCRDIKYREGAVAFATQSNNTWDDWDNYAKNNSHKREYWGQLDPEGGWQGNPYSPKNNPGGYGFNAAMSGAAMPGYAQQYAPRGPVTAGPQTAVPTQYAKPDINFATATKEELSYMYKAGIMD